MKTLLLLGFAIAMGPVFTLAGFILGALLYRAGIRHGVDLIDEHSDGHGTDLSQNTNQGHE